MKTKFLLSIFLLLNIGIATAQPLKPLETFLKEANADPARLSYVMSRCSAIFLDFAVISMDSNPDLSKSYENWSAAAMEKFIGLSELAIKQGNPSYKPPANQVEKAQKTVQGISNLYLSLLEESYQRTGSYLSNPMVKSDLELCGYLMKGK